MGVGQGGGNRVVGGGRDGVVGGNRESVVGVGRKGVVSNSRGGNSCLIVNSRGGNSCLIGNSRGSNGCLIGDSRVGKSIEKRRDKSMGRVDRGVVVQVGEGVSLGFRLCEGSSYQSENYEHLHVGCRC